MRISRLVVTAVALSTCAACTHSQLHRRSPLSSPSICLRLLRIDPNYEIWYDPAIDRERVIHRSAAVRIDGLHYAGTITYITIQIINNGHAQITFEEAVIWNSLWAPDIWFIDDQERYWTIPLLGTDWHRDETITLPAGDVLEVTTAVPAALLPMYPPPDRGVPPRDQVHEYPQQLHYGFVSDLYDGKESRMIIAGLGSCEIVGTKMSTARTPRRRELSGPRP